MEFQLIQIQCKLAGFFPTWDKNKMWKLHSFTELCLHTITEISEAAPGGAGDLPSYSMGSWRDM